MVVYGSIKIKKSPSPDVWGDIICLTYRVASPFVSAFRYDPKEACKHTWYVVAPNKTFLETTQAHTSSSQKSIFWDSLKGNYNIWRFWILQKMYFCDEDVWAWVVSKNFLLGATTYHVCLQASWGSYLNAETNEDVIRHLKKILRSQTSGDGNFLILILPHTAK